MSNIQLSVVDRLYLFNQFRILEILDADPVEQPHYQRAQAVLSAGYEREYEELFRSVHEPPMSREDCQEVYDILMMFRVLGDSYEDLDDKGEIDPAEIKFKGFSGNYESKQLGYAKYLNETRCFKESPAEDSHCPTLDTYRRMLNEFQQIENGGVCHTLSKEEIKRILAERMHPEHRQPQ